jgi:RNA polymerase sigma-70 factor (ECF subfamily)
MLQNWQETGDLRAMKRSRDVGRRAKAQARAPAKNITAHLADLHRGEDEASAQLMPLVYSQLRRIAAFHFKHEKPGHTLQPTAVLHETYLRLVKPGTGPWKSRRHFFAVASRAMRQILVDHARARAAEKRGGLFARVDFDEVIVYEPDRRNILALNDALDRLEALHRRQGRIVELRFFAGLTVKETAEVLGVSVDTVKTDWALAKAWLQRELDTKPA